MVAAETFDLFLDGFRGTVADRHHRDDGRNADHDAQNRQQRAQWIAANLPKRQQKRVAKHLFTLLRRIACDHAVDAMHAAPRIGRHIRLVRHEHDGDLVGLVEIG